MAAPSLDKLSQTLNKTKSRARLDDFVEELTSRFGGVSEVARRLVQEFDDGKPGGIGRAKLLDCYTRLLVMTNKKEAGTPISEMTDADLDAAIAEHVGKFLQSTRIEYPDGNTPPAPAANP